jgi:low temperature requirement protein LtrA
MAVTVLPPAEPVVETEHPVTPLELFFDLVLVFAITQVTGLLVADPEWAGLARGLLVLGALWWAWVGYAWLTNSVNAEDEINRLATFAAMAAMFVVSLAVPQAFGDDGVLFGAAYLVVRGLHLVLYATTARNEREVLAAVRRLAPGALLAAVLILAAGFADGVLQGALWALALLVDFGGTRRGGAAGWRVSPGHFAERHGLIVIIALGESIVAIGLGAGADPDAGVIAAALLGVVVSGARWWAYFDVVALVAERTLREATGRARSAQARDSYSYLHFPMVAGIILFAFGAKKTLAHVEDPLRLVPAVGLCGGVALYLLGHIGFRLRNVGTLNRQRLALAAVLLALVPVATEIPALASLAVIAALCAALIAFEAVRYAEARARVRAAT